MDSNIKLSNVIGAPFRSFVLKQFDQRTIHNSSENRELQEVLFLANKTAWVRLTSSVDVIGRTLSKPQGKTSVAYNTTSKQVYEALGVGTYGAENELAKNWVLEAGTSIQSGEGINLRSGIRAENASSITNSTLGAYGLGGTQELGFVPMPGLTSVTVETLGRLGSLRQATVNFRVNNLNQLNVIEALYFRLGYSMVLEWGHTQYYKNDGTFVTKDIYGLGSDIFNENLRKEDIITRINAKTTDTDGNYGGMLGIVTSFNWSASQDGGYDCTVKLIGRGAILDSLKTNQSYTLPNGTIEQYQKFEDFILNKIAKDTQIINDLKAKLEAGGTGGAVRTVEPPEPTPKDIDGIYKIIRKYQHKNDPNYTFKAFVQEYGYPIPDKNVFIPVQGQAIDYDLDRRSGQNDFVVFIPDFPWVGDLGLKEALTRKFSGYWIQHASEFLRVVPGVDKLGGTLNLTELNSQLYWARARVVDYGGTAEIGYFGDVQPNKALNTPLINKVLIAAAGNQLGNSDKSGKNVPIPREYGGVFVADLTATSNNPNATDTAPEWPLSGFVESSKYGIKNYNFGNDQNTQTFAVGGYNFRLQINVDSNFRTYQPTIDQVSEAFLKWLGGGTAINFGTLEIVQQDIPKNPSYTFFPKTYQIKGSIGLKVPNVPYSGDPVEAAATAEIKGYPVNNNVAPEVPVILTILTTNLSFFSNFTVNGKVYSPTPQPSTEGNTGDTNGTVDQSNTPQEKAPEGFSSALQAMLTIVQAKAQSAALQKTEVVVQDILEITRKFYTDGALNGVVNAAGQTAAPNLKITKGNQFTEFNLLNYAIKGFNSAIMADNALDLYNKILPVDYKALCKAYVIKYKQGGLEGVTNDVRSPTYIKLGYLLAFLNNMCLIYDSNKSRKTAVGNSTESKSPKKHPFLYIDFNPTTNFCYTQPQQLSIDPTICMIPLQKQKKAYEELFTSDEIIKNLDPKLFNPETENRVSSLLEENGARFTVDDGTDSAKYKGNLMNILINTQYLLDLCLNMSRNDPEHAVNLKPFLDQILIDVNKCLGGVNSFRASYVDESNVVQIVDDQWVPLQEGSTAKDAIGQATVLNQKGLDSKKATDPTTAGELPLDGTIIPSPEAPGTISIIGTKSITRDFRFNTTISSKLASKIAISAQAETGSVNSKDHSSYSHLNTFYEDRYSRSKEDPTTVTNAEKNTKTNDQRAADLFNDHVTCLYSRFSGYNPKNIEAAKNYYLQRMSKVKSSNPLTSASPYVALELEMTVDGISGIIMMNAFTVPNERLPYTYRGEGGKTKIAFIVTGLVHTIQNNEWLTKIKGQMIKLKEPVLIATPKQRIEAEQTSVQSITSAGVKGQLGVCKYGFGCQRGFGDAYKKTDLYKDANFRAGVEKINAEFGFTDPEALYKVMYAESGLKAGSVNPSANGKPFAVGLLQFTEDNVKGGVIPSLDEVSRTNGVDQLKWVRKYFQAWKGRVQGGNIYSIYGVTFFPILTSHLNEPDWVIQSSDLSAYTVSYQNPGIACAAGKLPGTPLTISDFKKYVDCIYG